MSEKEKAEQQLQAARTRGRRTHLFWRILPYVLFVALAVVVLYALGSDSEQQERISSLEQEVESSDTAAQAVAQEKQDQGRRISDLCASGEVDTSTERGKRVCEEAEVAAEEDPAEQVAAVGATGPRGAQGLPGRDGQDGADGADASPAAPGRDGVDGQDGQDSTVPGPTGAPGADGEDGDDSTVPGPQGDPGRSGADGKSVTGPQGPAGPKGDPGAAGKDSTVPGPQGPAGERGPAGANGRGITDAQCGGDGRWDITFTDGAVQDGGPCLVTPETPDPTPTPTEEVTE